MKTFDEILKETPAGEVAFWCEKAVSLAILLKEIEERNYRRDSEITIN